jgi:hypothetical protein
VVGPSEVALLLRVLQATLLVTRDPWLQLESRINCILLRIEDGALRPFGIDPDTIDPATFTLVGEPLIRPETDLSHLDRMSTVSLWLQHHRYMKKTRDFSSLGPGFARLSALHPIFEVPQCQIDTWSEYAQRHPNTITPDDIQSKVGITLDKFDTLNHDMAQCFFEWDLGWTPVKVFLDTLEKVSPDHRLRIVDFHDFQCATPNVSAGVFGADLDTATTPSKIGLCVKTRFQSCMLSMMHVTSRAQLRMSLCTTTDVPLRTFISPQPQV